MQQAIHVIDRRKKELGLSTAELCRIANIPEATYRNMTSGRSLKEPFDTIRALSLAVNLTLDELVSAMDDDASPRTAAALNNIAQTPATTQEVDTGFTILSRTFEKAIQDHQTELNALREHYDRLIVSKDAQFERERGGLVNAIRALSLITTALVVTLCIVLIV